MKNRFVIKLRVFVFAILLGMHFDAFGLPGKFTALTKKETLKVQFEDLHPTQLGLGLIAVQKKMERLAEMSKKERKKYLKQHPVPVIVGPGGVQLYLIDHHHMSLALHWLGVSKIRIKVVENKSRLSPDKFALWMKEKKYTYLFDENDQKVEFEALPLSILEMHDDPFRSLAGVVEDHEGFEKTGVPFMEFEWARFYRSYFFREEIQSDFDSTLKKALRLAQSREASYLPGYLGRHSKSHSCEAALGWAQF